MNVIDKTLYHQIHPFKLTTDVISAFAAVYLCWLHLVIIGLIVAFVPSIMISLFMIRLMDFEKQKHSRFGRYVKRYMGRGADISRSVGFFGMLAGGWLRLPWMIALGFLVILATWMNGLVYKRQMPVQASSRRRGR